MQIENTEAMMLAFWLQAVLLPLYIPLSYISYKLMKLPKKEEQVRKGLAELRHLDSFEHGFDTAYSWHEYVGPILLAYVLTLTTFSITHPYVIEQGWWSGILEEMIDIFGPDNPFPRSIIAGRFLFWGWLGGYIYSVFLTFSRFIEFDLTPNVYIFTAKRFFLALTVGAIVGVGFGTYATSGGLSFNLTFVSVSIIAFTIGFFPEQGINWLLKQSRKLLGLAGVWKNNEEITLSEIQGLSIWQQTRLHQENIFSVQNLACADIADLVIKTPYTLDQIIDWVDQAIYRMIIEDPQDKPRVSRASLQVIAAEKTKDTIDLRIRLSDDEEDDTNSSKEYSSEIISDVFESWGKNMLLITAYRWKYSLNDAKRRRAKTLFDQIAEAPQLNDEQETNLAKILEAQDSSKDTVDKISESDDDTEIDHIDSNTIELESREPFSPKKDNLKPVDIQRSVQPSPSTNGYHFDQLIEEKEAVKLFLQSNNIDDKKSILKIIDPSRFDQKFKEGFIRRLESIQRLNRLKGYAQIYNFGEYEMPPHSGHLFLEVQYLELQHSLRIAFDYFKHKPEKRLPLEELHQIIGNICLAVDQAHKVDVVHGNLRPSNIFVDNDFVSTLVGFEDLALVQHEKAMQISPYAGPGQERTFPINLSDIYAIGIILYELLSGQLPTGEKIQKDIKLTQRLHLPNSRHKDVNADLRTIIEKATAKNYVDRYNDGASLIYDLDTALGLDTSALSHIDRL